ncbi:MAG: glutamate racemase [Bacteroidota bacterium]
MYVADVVHAPYGNKSAGEVHELVLSAADFIHNHNPKALLVACNTATSASVDALRSQYSYPIIGMEPAIKPALAEVNGRVLVMATHRTLVDSKFSELIDQLEANSRIISLPMMRLVTYAESFDFHSASVRDYISEQLMTVDISVVDAIVLGCTHFVFFREVIREICPDHIRLFDGHQGTVKQLISQIPVADVNPGSIAPLRVFLSGKEVDPELVRPYFNQYRRTSGPDFIP